MAVAQASGEPDEKQDIKLRDLLKYNLRSVRSYLLKEEFQLFWQYISLYWAGMFLDKRCTETLRSKIELMKKVARMLRRHRPLLLNWFGAKKQFSSGIVEGFNTKAKLTTRKVYSFRTYHDAEVALYHSPGHYLYRKPPTNFSEEAKNKTTSNRLMTH